MAVPIKQLFKSCAHYISSKRSLLRLSSQALSDYTLPKWFIQHCVRVPEELQSTSSPPPFCPTVPEQDEPDRGLSSSSDDTSRNAQEQASSATSHGLLDDKYEQLRDITRAALLADSDGKLVTRESTICITAPLCAPDPSAVVERLALDFDASLILLDELTLRNIARDLVTRHPLDQPSRNAISSLTGYSSGNICKRGTSNKRSLRASKDLNRKMAMKLVCSPDRRRVEFPHPKQPPKPTMSVKMTEDNVFIHYKSTPKSNTKRKSDTILCNLQSMISEQRLSGRKVLLYTTCAADDDLPWKSQLDKDSASFFKLARDDFTTNDSKTGWIRDINTRDLKLGIDYRLSRSFDLDLIKPWSRWMFINDDKDLDFMGKQLLEEKKLEDISAQVIGHTGSGKSLDEEDVRTVLLRHSPHSSPAPKHSDALASLYGRCDQKERGLFGAIVDLTNIKAGYKDVVIDAEILQGAKAIIGFSLCRDPQEDLPHPLLTDFNIGGALFSGPPGTGKTHLCRAVAKEFNANLLVIDTALIRNKWVGESEKHIKAAFSLATKLHPCILFIDEADALFFRRSESDPLHERALLTQILQEMDGLVANTKSPFVIAATNRPSDLDAAFLRRLPFKIAFKLPNRSQRCDLFRLLLKDENLEPGLTIERLAEKTVGYSGSDINNVCVQAALNWKADDRESKDQTDRSPKILRLTESQFSKALKSYQVPGRSRPDSSLENDELKPVEKFRWTLDNEWASESTDGYSPRYP